MTVSRFTTAAALLAMAWPMVCHAAPRIDGPLSRACTDTRLVADTAFHSTAFRLNEAVTLAPDSPVRIVAQRTTGDMSQGDAKTVDPHVFTTVKGDDTSDFREFDWQISATAGKRWVIVDSPAGWRGDTYSLYAVGATATKDQALDPADRILTQIWIPPLMLRDKASGVVWAVDTQADTWYVYTVGKDGVKARCHIVFAPPAKTTFDRLPPAVRTLAVDLDGTMGDGRGEGTLNQTGRLRGEVDLAWYNLVLRPWAMTTKPYNSRSDAEAGLRLWSRGAPSFRALYARIQADYPLARDVLADLYVRDFAKTPEAAKALAETNLDIVYRSHFVFPKHLLHPPATQKPAS